MSLSLPVLPSGNPVSNTGLFCNVSIDTISYIFRGPIAHSDVSDHLLSLQRIFLDVFEFHCDEPRLVGRRYSHYAVGSDTGILAVWDTVEDSSESSLRIEITGRASSRLSLSDKHTLISLLHVQGAEFTRIDPYVDFPVDSIPVQSMIDSIRVGNVVGLRWKNPKSKAFYDPISDGLRGFTLYLGSPTSEKRQRIYDKSVESNGSINSWRMEGQFRGGYSKNFVDLFISESPDKLSQFILSTLTGMFDFRDRSASKYIDDCPRLDFWQSFLDLVAAIPKKVPAPRFETSVDKSVKFINRIMGTIAMSALAIGVDEFIATMKAKILDPNTMKTSHVNKLQAYREVKLSYV